MAYANLDQGYQTAGLPSLVQQVRFLNYVTWLVTDDGSIASNILYLMAPKDSCELYNPIPSAILMQFK